MSEQSLYGDVPFTLNSFTPTLKVTVTCHQSYKGISGNDPWGLFVYLDGNLVNSVGGAGIGTETPILVAVAKNVGAGGHTLRVTWSGSSNITMSQDCTTVEASYK